MARYVSGEQMTECPECEASFSLREGKRYINIFDYHSSILIKGVIFACPCCRAAVHQISEGLTSWTPPENLQNFQMSFTYHD